MKDATLGQIGIRLAFTLALVIAVNMLMFALLYGDTFTTITLPYAENFDRLDRLTYRQFGGNWQVNDGALLQTIQDDTDLFAVLPLRLETSHSYRFEADMQFVSGAKGGGLLFNMQNADKRQQSHLVRFGVDPDGVSYLVYGYFDENLNFVSQGSVTPFDAINNADRASLALAIHGVQYEIRVNDVPVQAAIPLQYFGGNVALTTWFSQVAFDNVEVIQSSEAAAEPTALPVQEGVLFTDTFDDVSRQGDWQPFSGNWTFEPGALVQTKVDGFDFGASANERFQQYILRVEFQHRQGEGGGVLFNMPYRDSQRGAHMVRYFPDNTLAWGYFDDQNNFHGQGSQAVSSPSTSLHTLEIRVGDAYYAITLDGMPLVENIPLLSYTGYVGLTTSQSVVSFERIEVFPLGAQVSAGIAGDWQQSSNTIIQQSTALSDYFTSTGVSAEVFQASVEITLAEGTGGGLVFGALADDIVAGTHLVRLVDGGQRLEWGVLDQQQQFQRQGGADLSTMNLTTHLLELNVGSETYSISVDDVRVASDLPHTAQTGWINFNSMGGPVTFANFRLSLTSLTD
jgi:hypothetical protein